MQGSDWVGYHDEDKITELLVGHSVNHIDGSSLYLENGTRLEIVGNEGGCSCSSGDYDLTHLATTENVITGVEFDYRPDGDYTDAYEGEESGFYRVFVYTGDDKINLFQVDGSDGNGYYGTGYFINVYPPTQDSGVV